jgi:hypothetical protein
MQNFADARALVRTRTRLPIAVIGLGAALVLGALMGQLFAASAAPGRPADVATGTQPVLAVQTTTWTAGGETAPGARRLHLEVVVFNAGRASVSASPDTFAVRGADGRVWQPVSSAPFGAPAPVQTLTAGEQRIVDLVVDVPATVPALRLTWTHHGQIDSVPVL